jgi:hypothetical protein
MEYFCAYHSFLRSTVWEKEDTMDRQTNGPLPPPTHTHTHIHIGSVALTDIRAENIHSVGMTISEETALH